MEIARFFYKNESLLSSLYAQLFSGLLASVEKVKRTQLSHEAPKRGLMGFMPPPRRF